MRGQTVALAMTVLFLAMPAGAQTEADAAEARRTAEQFIAISREVYAVDEPEPEAEPCAAATAAEIVVCRERDKVPDQRLPSPTERANAAGEMPPDPVPRAPNVFGLPPCSSYTFCTKIGRPPPPILIIDLAAIPEPLTPEEAALVFRTEEAPEAP